MSSKKVVKTFSSTLAVWAYITAAVKTITENVFYLCNESAYIGMKTLAANACKGLPSAALCIYVL